MGTRDRRTASHHARRSDGTQRVVLVSARSPRGSIPRCQRGLRNGGADGIGGSLGSRVAPEAASSGTASSRWSRSVAALSATGARRGAITPARSAGRRATCHDRRGAHRDRPSRRPGRRLVRGGRGRALKRVALRFRTRPEVGSNRWTGADPARPCGRDAPGAVPDIRLAGCARRRRASVPATRALFVRHAPRTPRWGGGAY
jgi:hypothetical protein